MATIDIYARVSLDADLKHKSTDDQVLDCRDRIEDAGHEVGEVFIDNSKSAWNPRVKRERWEALMTKIESGACEGLIVFDMARFSRKPIDGERLIAAANKGMIILDSENAYDLNTANGRKTFRDHMNAAAYESDRLSTRVRRGKRRKVDRGQTNHSHRPFGFEPDGVTLREPEATLLREATERVLSGASLRSVRLDWHARGIKTTFGNDWSQAAFRLALSRARNAGLIESKGVIVGRLATEETIVTEEQWRRMVDLLASRAKGRPLSDGNLGSGGVLVCGVCGANLYAGVDSRGKRRYRCNATWPTAGCGKITIDADKTEEVIETLVLDLLAEDQVRAARQAVADEHATRRRELAAELSEAEGVAEAMADRLGAGQVKLAAYEAFTARHDARVARLQAELDALPEAPERDEELATLTAAELRTRWAAAASNAERRRLAKQALRGECIVVAPVGRSAPRRFNLDRLSVAPRPVREVAA